MDQTTSRLTNNIEDMRAAFLLKASDYFDNRVNENDKAADVLAMDMSILIKRGRAYKIAIQKHR